MSQLPNFDEVQVLDKELGLRLAYFIRSAAGAKIEQPYSPLDCHAFVAQNRKLVVVGTDRVTGNYLLKLFQQLRSYAAEAMDQRDFEQGVSAIAGPLREDLVRRLALEQFWRDDQGL